MKTHPKTSFTGPELCKLDAVEVVELLRKKEISPKELLDSSFERINQVEPSVNAIPTLCEERAREAINIWKEKEQSNIHLYGLQNRIELDSPMLFVR